MKDPLLMLHFGGTALLLALALPTAAQVESPGGTQGASGLGGTGGLGKGGAEGLQGGKGLQSKRGSLGTGGGLGGATVQPAPRAASIQLQGARTQAGCGLVHPATLKQAAQQLTRDGLTQAKLEGAASTIPPSQVGALLFGVAGELEAMVEVDMTDVAVGYYMGSLADPEGERHEAAKRRLHEIFLDLELAHQEAQRIYQVGVETFEQLGRLKIGLTPEGMASARRDLLELKLAYRARREQEPEEGSVAQPAAPNEPESVHQHAH